MITVQDLNVALSEEPVLDEVSMTVESGELLGLIGPNGAGKTTLLRTIAGLIEPTTGTVRVADAAIRDLSRREISRRIAVVPQQTNPSFTFSVRDIVAMGRTPYQTRLGTADPNGTVAIESALELTNIASLADRPITDVSGGECQRVLIARALAQDTPVLLLDEPTASLDINYQLGTFSLITELIDSGKTAIAAIHDLGLAARYCDRLLLLSQGEVRAAGTPREVLEPERLRRVFDTAVAVHENPATGAPSVTPVDVDPTDRDV